MLEVEALDVKLSEEDLEKLEACYVPHPIVGAIDKNPEQGECFPLQIFYGWMK